MSTTYTLHSDPITEAAGGDDSGFDVPSRRLLGLRGRSAELLVLIVALAARLGVIVREGGIHGIIGYDCGVYFAGADALIHGRLPYRDFTMVHPPGITLLLTPFASLTHWMSDWHAFIVATFAFCLLGAVNAVLVVVVCRRLGFSALGAGTAGLFYAAWYGSVSGEFEIKLEPLGNFFLLCGFLLLLRAQRKQSRWSNVTAGLVLGLMIAIKIWWIVPLVVLIGWHAWRRRSVRSGLMVTLGAALSATAVYGPFFIADPSGMFHSVILDQLGRSTPIPGDVRISQLTTLPELFTHLSHATKIWTSVPFGLAAVAVLVLAWRASVIARIFATLVVIQFAVLMAAPSWLLYYSDYLAVSLAICIGAAASTVIGMRLRRIRMAPPLVLTAAMVAITTGVTITGVQAIRPYTGATALTRDVRTVRCVMTDNPTVLLRLDVFTRDLEAGCPEWIDVTGTAFGVGNQTLPRSENLPWQRDYVRYLRSGEAILLWHPNFSAATWAAVTEDGVLARAGGHTLYRVVH